MFHMKQSGVQIIEKYVLTVGQCPCIKGSIRVLEALNINIMEHPMTAQDLKRIYDFSNEQPDPVELLRVLR